MNWKSIVADFNTLQVKHKQLNSFGVGDIKQLIYLTQNRDKQDNVDNNAPYYPLMYVLPGSVSQDEQYTTYGFNILICDVMNVKNYDIQNELLSDTLEICQDILAQFKYSVNALQGDYYTDKYDIVLPANITPFMEAYDDILVGWNLPMSIQVQTPLNRCIAPFNYWDITPSPTPTSTTTPTPTPSITPTNTPSTTPTNTPSITPTLTNTPSATPPKSLTYITSRVNQNSLSSYTYTGLTISPGTIVVLTSNFGGFSNTGITGATLNGVSMTQFGTPGGSFGYYWDNFYLTTTATTTDITINYFGGASPSNNTIGVYRLNNLNSNTPYAYYSLLDTLPAIQSFNLSVSANSVSAFSVMNALTPPVLTGGTINDTIYLNTGYYVSYGDFTQSSGGTRTMTWGDGTGSGTQHQIQLGVWQ